MITKRLMQIVAVQSLFYTLAIAYEGNSQRLSMNDVYVTLEERQMKVIDVFKEIETNSQFKFSFEKQDINNDVDFTFKGDAYSIYEILEYVGKKASLNFRRINNVIDVSRAERKFSKPSVKEVFIDKTITGTVTDENGNGLPGVNVLVKDTNIGVVTDINGDYKLDVPDDATVLVFSYVGYLTEEVDITGRTIVDFSLTPDIETLSEIVVLGYGTKKAKDLTGSVKQVSGEDFQNNAIQSSTLALQGRVAGVRITNNGGRPGRGGTIRIRGTTTRNNNEPLYVIDGQIVTTGLGFLNPNDIESMTVLKDASAAAIYGSRAAAGVIVVKTKRGRAGKPVIEYNAFYTWDDLTNKVDILNADEYEQVNTEWFTNAGQTSALIPPAIRGNTDWQDLIFRTGHQQNHHLSVSGGNENHQYAFQGGYFHQEGLVQKSSLDRYNIRLNQDLSISKKWKLASTVDASYAKGNQTNDGSVVFHAQQSPPNLAPYDANGDLVFSGYTRLNPLAVLASNRPVDDNLRILGNLSLEYEIIDGLSAKTFISTEFVTTQFQSFTPRISYPADPVGANNNDTNILNTRTQRQFVWTWDNTLSYSKSVGEHNFSVLFGHTAQSSNRIFRNITARNFLSNDASLQFVDATLTPDETSASNNAFEWSIASLIGRVSYDYKGKYLFDGNFRRDRSSRIHTDFRDAFFPSASVGWVLSEESFFNVPFIDRLKIRAGWGEIGNERSGSDYPYQEVYRTGADAIFGGAISTGVFVPRSGNPALEWETTTTKNIALDLNLFDNSVSLTTDYFIKDTDGILFSPDQSALSGVAAPIQNTSNIRNTGIEFELAYRKSIGDLYLEVSPNYTYIKNEIISLSETEDARDASIGKSRVGRPFSTYDIGYIADGIFQNQAEVDAHAFQTSGTAPGDIRFKDLNNDGVINTEDRDWLGVGVPPHNYGISILAQYKGFDLNILGTGQAGGEARWTGHTGYHNFVRPFEITAGYLRGRWHGEGTSNLYPRIVAGDPNDNARFSTLLLESTNYFRIQNIQLGYTFPKELVESINLSSLRAYVAGQNLFTFTDFEGYDPQTGYGGYPVPRSIYIGLNIKL
ncbi:TonB-dependent receptor [Fulvivirgaceae bacterium BMA10]|uniref:TonB-dependent receptor n=1 Tax=Splendidivirga corallicola TaxID=3051826 RepID=A0ABT8KTW3_9BACT|nr:TonB-dependent receptor [Fulvivirgaceae bacterium BMA10]